MKDEEFETAKLGTKIQFTVHGRPQQRGSKNSFVPINKKTKKPFRRANGGIVVSTVDSNKNSKVWMGQVRDAAAAAFDGDLIHAAVCLTCAFYFKRPASHLGTGKRAGQLKPSAPEHHTQTPDLDKLLRCVGDSLTGVILADDKQICCFGDGTGKFWTSGGEHCTVTIEVIEE